MGTSKRVSIEPSAPRPRAHAAWAVVLLAVLVHGCASPAEPDRGSTGTTAEAITLDARRSLFVTDTAVLAQFSFQRTMQQIVTTSGVSITPLQLFQQWWDTQNDRAHAVTSGGAHCDDETTSGQPSHNHFQWECPRVEGGEASQTPFGPIIGHQSPDPYIPVALVNRFDLAPADGSNCGEYRIIYARASGQTDPANRNLVIFEAVMPNPHPECGLSACQPVAQFWADLSSVSNVTTLTSDLVTFFYTGIAGFEPAVHADHYGLHITPDGKGTTTGQIRSNSFMQRPWMLHQFSLVHDCRCGVGACTLGMVPVNDAVTPNARLFDTTFTDPLGRSPTFQSFFSNSATLGTLAVADVNLFTYDPADQFDNGQSASQPNNAPVLPTDESYVTNFAPSVGGPFDLAIQANVPPSSGLTSQNMVERALTQTCAGCHQLSNGHNLGGGLTWPTSLGFTQVTEASTETGPFGTRFVISPALTGTFLPFRATVLSNFLGAPGRCVTTGSAPAAALGSVSTDACVSPGTSGTRIVATASEVHALTPPDRVRLNGTFRVH